MSNQDGGCCQPASQGCATEDAAVSEDKIRQQVRESYSKVAEASNEGDSCGNSDSCCGVSDVPIGLFSTRFGYSNDDVDAVPEGADMGLGCGNPRAIAGIQAGETVLDLGSGGGFDCFLAARELNHTGNVIGVDMTPTMISKARANAEKTDYRNVEFRLGEIEYLPIADNSVDVIISNCVINLSPNKLKVFKEVMRVLKPGGRIAISDVVATTEFPEDIKNDLALYSSCISGASLIDELESILISAGFQEIGIAPKDESREFIKDWAPGSSVENFVVSAHITGSKSM